MNQFKNGTLLVIIATVVISALMLITGIDKAPQPKTQSQVVTVATDEKEVEVVTEEKDEATVTEEAVTEESVEPIDTVDAVENNNTSNQEINTLVSDTQAELIKAPEGPYSSEENTSDKVENENPEKDVQQASNSEISEAPDQSIQVESINAVATSNQHDLLNHIIEPIWMDQKLGDFKSVEKGEVVFKLLPTNSGGLQGEDPTNVVTSKSDKFAPTTVSADYNYQQMPMYNGGYYIAPMPPYLMRSILPTSPVIKDN